MTLISALISIKGTAVSTDSLLTIKRKDETGSFDQIEWKLPKVVRLEKFAGTISFWGDAVAEPKYPIPIDKNNVEYNWTLYSWLIEKCKNVIENDLENFVIRLTEELGAEYGRRNWLQYGFGLHVTGYELVDGKHIPELFLISNYANTNYNELKELSYSRETYHTLTKTPPDARHRDHDCRSFVYDHLINGGLFIYNNGDPNLFNPVFNAIFDSYLLSRQQDKVKEITDLENLISLVRRPIEIVSKFQSDFFKPDKTLVGGRIHDLAVWHDKRYTSTSGD